jgi:hypothetical protein
VAKLNSHLPAIHVEISEIDGVMVRTEPVNLELCINHRTPAERITSRYLLVQLGFDSPGTVTQL